VAHASARLTPLGRRILVDRIAGGWTITHAAQAAGISRQTGSKWWRRFRHDGTPGLRERSSAVHHQARRHDPAVVAAVCALREERRVGPHVLAWERSWHARRSMPSCAAIGSTVLTASTRDRRGALRACTPGRADPPRHQEARQDRAGWRSPRARPCREASPPPYRLGPPPCRSRRLQPACLCRGVARRVARHDGRLPGAGQGLLRCSPHRHRTRPDRQRHGLSQQAFAARAH
jgi:transposase-like protein